MGRGSQLPRKGLLGEDTKDRRCTRPGEKFLSWETLGMKGHLTSGGRMGSPQAAHLGANTLGGEQRSSETHAVFLEGKAEFLGDLGPGLPGPPLWPGSASSSPEHTAWLTLRDSLPQCLGVVPQRHRAPSLYWDRD